MMMLSPHNIYYEQSPNNPVDQTAKRQSAELSAIEQYRVPTGLSQQQILSST
jgi:hypothetical protein